MAVRILSADEAHVKCHLGERDRCCKYLTVDPAGLDCSYVDEPYRRIIDAKVARGDFVAKSGPCADPYDSTSEAKPYEAGGP